MKASKSATRKVRRWHRSASAPHLASKRRPSLLKMDLEALEARTLLSVNPADTTSGVVAQTGSLSGVSISELPAGLVQSLQDANTVATVSLGSSTSGSGSTTSQAIDVSHIYTGRPTTFIGPGPMSATGTGSALSSLNPSDARQGLQGAPDTATGAFKAIPQYLVMPSGPSNANFGRRGEPQGGTGPAGYAPAQIVGAYGINLIQFGAIKGDGAELD
jgi:hypothetical protein